MYDELTDFTNVELRDGVDVVLKYGADNGLTDSTDIELGGGVVGIPVGAALVKIIRGVGTIMEWVGVMASSIHRDGNRRRLRPVHRLDK